ncbi:zinc-dependent alcohol dehydrogenase [Agromyces silvae]|uniref:zinc-dependent alcohol dehydrogenase n=1 Tax=Agromyces silvae TaxID=3388266 RepID=UPI00280BA544|nr:alcohol dehydrogenase catalytic domain-containing protein [Agromyces protaetiae]
MLAATYAGHQTIQLTPVTPEPPTTGQVQVRVAYVGLCGTDLHIFHGNMDGRVERPLIFGHEMSGTIEAVGAGVDDWAVGDHVTVMPLAWDGTCPACRAGHTHICQHLDFIGIDSPGALQPLWNVPATTLVRLPETLALDHAALVEPVAVAVHDVRRAGVSRGDRAVVIGGGPIGVLIASVARATGADVLVIEPDAGRRGRIEALGFATTDPIAGDQVAVVEAWTGGAGADVVFEVSGAAAAVLGATSLAKVRGTLVVVAIHPTPREIDLQRVFWRELSILGARVYERTDFDEAVRLLASGEIPVDAMITDVVPLDGVADAFAELEAGRAMKVLVNVQSGAAR